MAEVSLAATVATPSIPSSAVASGGASPAAGQPFADVLTALAEPTGIAAAATVLTIARPIAPPPELTALPATADVGVEPRTTATKSGADGDSTTDDPAGATPATPTPDLSAFLALIAPPTQAIATSTRPLAAADVGIATATTRAPPPGRSAPVRSASVVPTHDLPATNDAAIATTLPAMADTISAAGGQSSPVAPASASIGQAPAGAAAMEPDADATSPNPSVTVSAQTVSITSASRSQNVPAQPATAWQPETPATVAAPRADAFPAHGLASAGNAPPPQGAIAAAASATALFTPVGDAPVAVEGAGPVPSPAASPLVVDDASIRTRIVATDPAEPKVATAGGAEPQEAVSPPARKITGPLRVADVRIDPAMPRLALAAVAGATGSTPAADDPVSRQLSIAQDGQWLDALTRDIASAGNSDGQLRFRLDPDHLGSLTVQIAQGSDGASIRLTASTEAARAILADAQPRLVAEARAQGLVLRDATVETRGAAPTPATPASTGAGFSAGSSGSGRGDHGGVAAQLQQQSQQQGGNRPRAPEPERPSNPAPRGSTPTRSGADLYA